MARKPSTADAERRSPRPAVPRRVSRARVGGVRHVDRDGNPIPAPDAPESGESNESEE